MAFWKQRHGRALQERRSAPSSSLSRQITACRNDEKACAAGVLLLPEYCLLEVQVDLE